jgi:osmotically-inducible protein OsmY
MLKKLSVVFCGAAVILMTAGHAIAQGDAVADAATTAAVKTKLLADTKVGGLGIDVDTKDNVVTLTGKVRSVAERTEALRLARTTTGVKDVVSKLVVDPTYKGVTNKDDKAKAEIKDETRDARGTAGRAADKTKAEAKEAKVEIKDDTKETAAKVKDATKKGAEKTGDAAKKVGEKTKDVAQDAAGKTKSAAAKTKDVTTDASITAAVKTKLLGDTAVRGLKIDVDTKDNVVTLTGTVRSAAEKAEAIRLAKTTTGVKSVVDKLTIQP